MTGFVLCEYMNEWSISTRNYVIYALCLPVEVTLLTDHLIGFIQLRLVLSPLSSSS